MKKEGNGKIYYLIYKEKVQISFKFNENSKNLQQNKPMESWLQYLHNGQVLLYWGEMNVY